MVEGIDWIQVAHEKVNQYQNCTHILYTGVMVCVCISFYFVKNSKPE